MELVKNREKIQAYKERARQLVDKMTLEVYKKMGVKYVRWITKMDGHACETCRNGALPLPDAAPGADAAHASYDDSAARFTSLVREADGVCILLEGRWRVAQD